MMQEIKVTDLQRVLLAPGEVLVLRADLKSLQRTSIKPYLEALKNTLDGVFPNNKIVVLDDRIEMVVLRTGDSES